jgi:hypothetical protein
MTENLKIRSANPTDADELLAIRRDAIMALPEQYGRVAAERWASAAHPDRAAKAIATNNVWVTEFGSKVVGWVEVSGATIESLYVSSAALRSAGGPPHPATNGLGVPCLSTRISRAPVVHRGRPAAGADAG